MERRVYSPEIGAKILFSGRSYVAVPPRVISICTISVFKTTYKIANSYLYQLTKTVQTMLFSKLPNKIWDFLTLLSWKNPQMVARK